MDLLKQSVLGRIGVPVEVVAFCLTACSSNSSNDSPNITLAPQSPSTSGALSLPGATSTTILAPDLNTPFCKDVAAFTSANVDFVSAENLSNGSFPITLPPPVWTILESLPKIASEAPLAIQSETQTLSTAMAPYLHAIHVANGDMAKVPHSITNAAYVPQVEAAGSQFDAYVLQKCGVKNTGDSSSN